MQKGFTIFFAMLIGALALSIGFAIYDLTIREIDLSSAATQSQFAIYAADTGVECALYWDSKYNGTKSAFGTTSSSVWGTGVTCNGQDISAYGVPPTPIVPPGPSAGWLPWDHSQSGATYATTTFTLSFLQTGQAYCTVVDVGKATISNVLYTTVISRGYNTCVSGGAARLERTLRVNY